MSSDAGLEAVYAEATQIARYFWDWRYKLLTYSLTLNVALFTAAGWTYVHLQHGENRWISVFPLAGGIFTSVLLAVMDHRNSRLLDWAYAVAAPIEEQWLAKAGGRVQDVPGFYDRIVTDVGREHKFWHAWGIRAKRSSAYTIILRWWFTITFLVYTGALVADVLHISRAI